MKNNIYKPSGICARMIEYTLDDNNTILDVQFTGGCHGNTQGLSALVKGMKADEVIECLEGINCGGKGTSCPDQLAKALKQELGK